MNINKSARGFTVVEILLVLIFLAIAGFSGYYVYHAQKTSSKITPQNSTQKTNTAASKSSVSPNQKVLDIKEWGVKVNYTSADDTLTYSIGKDSPSVATVISAKLARTYGCTTMGAGQIGRYSGEQTTYATVGSDNPTTVAAAAAADPVNWIHVGNYYYRFAHDQALCPDKDGYDVTTVQNAQNAANTFVAKLLPSLSAE